MKAVFYGDVAHRIAGAQKSLLTALGAARSHGLDPTMVFSAEGAFEKLCRAQGLRVRILPGPPSFHVFGKALLRKSLLGQLGVIVRETLPYGRDLARLLDEERAEVVHYNTARGVILAAWGAHLSGRNVVMHQRGSVAIGKAPWLTAQALSDRILLVARALMPEVSPSVRPRARVLYNGVNIGLPILDRTESRAAVAKQLASRLPITPETPLLVSLSSPTPFKGLHYLVEAAALAKSRGIRAIYVLAGEPKPGGYQAWLTRKIDDLGLTDTVALVGFVEDTHRLLCAADALILPTVARERIDTGAEIIEDRSNEGLPRSVLEAMLAGIPSIATDIAGVREQIDDGKTGLLVPEKDPASLSAAIERIVTDKPFRDSAGPAARETVTTRFRLEDTAKGLVQNLRETAAEPSSLPHKLARWPALARDALTI